MSWPERILLVDHRDSFVFNLFQAIGTLTGVEARVVRHDAVDLDALAAWSPQRVVLSPGPGDPTEPRWFGAGAELVRRWGPTTPILGVCLGHQGIAAAYGARVERAPSAVFGKTSEVHHEGLGLFESLPSPFVAMRYHALMVTELPPCLQATAWADDGVLMGLQHRDHPVHGVQFHPESYATPVGQALLARFLRG